MIGYKNGILVKNQPNSHNQVFSEILSRKIEKDLVILTIKL